LANNIPKVPARLVLKKDENATELQRQQNLLSVTLAGMQGADILANRPPSPPLGATYYATDTVPPHFYVFGPAGWITLL